MLRVMWCSHLLNSFKFFYTEYGLPPSCGVHHMYWITMRQLCDGKILILSCVCLFVYVQLIELRIAVWYNYLLSQNSSNPLRCLLFWKGDCLNHFYKLPFVKYWDCIVFNQFTLLYVQYMCNFNVLVWSWSLVAVILEWLI